MRNGDVHEEPLCTEDDWQAAAARECSQSRRTQRPLSVRTLAPTERVCSFCTRTIRSVRSACPCAASLLAASQPSSSVSLCRCYG